MVSSSAGPLGRPTWLCLRQVATNQTGGCPLLAGEVAFEARETQDGSRAGLATGRVRTNRGRKRGEPRCGAFLVRSWCPSTSIEWSLAARHRSAIEGTFYSITFVPDAARSSYPAGDGPSSVEVLDDMVRDGRKELDAQHAEGDASRVSNRCRGNTYRRTGSTRNCYAVLASRTVSHSPSYCCNNRPFVRSRCVQTSVNAHTAE